VDGEFPSLMAPVAHFRRLLLPEEVPLSKFLQVSLSSSDDLGLPHFPDIFLSESDSVWILYTMMSPFPSFLDSTYIISRDLSSI
jgi:hypothetical protein